VVHVYSPSYSGGRDQEDLSLRPVLAKMPNTRKGLAGGMAQMVECLPSKREALGSDPNSTKKKKGSLDIHIGRMPDAK
jgi:hypothetical protein